MTERLTIRKVALREERDVVTARREAREVAAQLGLDNHEQTRLATAVSELARQAFRPGGSAAVTFSARLLPRPHALEVRISSYPLPPRQPVATEASAATEALVAARRLVDDVDVQPRAHDVGDVILRHAFSDAIDREAVRRIGTMLEQPAGSAVLDEMRRQNEELLRLLQTLRERQDELERVNHELEDTNRGVLALYAELDEQSERLRKASEFKTRFLRHVTHEFRTPLHSIMAITHLLLERLDGDLTPEQERQARLILQAANDLSEMTNDLLDLAKVEAGRLVPKPTPFEVRDLFSTLRGLMRPLVVNEAVKLTFDAPDDIPDLTTDEAKLSQILRNLISNALKFTEAGQVAVTASHDPVRNTVSFSVADTGIGIAPEDQERIFAEFSQLDHPIQKKVRGTGLGLPLSRRLAELLGGTLQVVSAPGVGSTFTATVPRLLVASTEVPGETRMPSGASRRTLRVLIADDDEPWRYVLRRALETVTSEVHEAGSGNHALRVARETRPDVLVLDLGMPDGDGWFTLDELAADADLHATPVVVVTQQVLGADQIAALGRRGVPVLSKANVWPKPDLLVDAVIGAVAAGKVAP